MLNTARLLDGCFAAPLPPNRDVHIAPGSCVAVYGQRQTYSEHRPIFHTPPDARCYALQTQAQLHRFGLARLGTYTLPDFPGELFQLGLSGEMTIAPAHVVGLEPLLQAQGSGPITLRALLTAPETDARLRIAVAGAVSRFCGGPDWDYPALAANRARLTECCLQEIFPMLYACGLLLYPRRFIIRELSPPLLMAERACRI